MCADLAIPTPPAVIIEPVVLLVEFVVSVVFSMLAIPSDCVPTITSLVLTLHWSKVSVKATLAVMVHSSYLLIGFWYEKPSAASAAKKAFIVTRVGDVFLLLGLVILFNTFGTLRYSELFSDPELLSENAEAVKWATLCIFGGAVGKSAQFPLHVWLPDAMEGPTPVSALIHAATMVTAGVFLVVRCSPIFEYSQVALNVVTAVGMTTAFFAATVALVQNDIKKIVAYSTCSQLGYMFFAAGVGAYHVAIFHLFTHAFFKALLFLGSGCVIHSFNDEQDIRSMGGVWKKIHFTYVLMIIGALALTGFPFLSGYYSKEAIIEFAYLRGSTIGYVAAAVGIFTALSLSIIQQLYS